MKLFTYFSLFSILFIGIGSQTIQAQSTFEDVLTIFDENGCSGGYCHGGGGFLSGDLDEVYNKLVGATPQNGMAQERGDKIIDPGYPERSFLYRKINQGLYSDSPLHVGDDMEVMEGNHMPPSQDGTGVSNRDKEMIRQWIYYGAPKTGQAFGNNIKNAIEEFHTEGGIGLLEQPPAPDPSEGFQVQLGPVFLQPGEEIEYLKKYDLKLEEGVEVNRIEAFMAPNFSHHFILYKYINGSTANEGLREVTIFDNPFGSDANFVSIWQEDEDFRLPEGTAYRWQPGTILDLNYHIINYSNASVLAANVYFNVYTQELGTADKEMFSDLALNLLIPIPNTEDTITHTDVFGNSSDINIWMLSSHTHKYGKDFDIYLEDEDGEKGLQLFEGLYNSDYTSYEGVYDYAHPPIRYFDNFLRIPNNQNLIQEAKFINNGPTSVNFGLTSDDEMMITVLQYTKGDSHQEPIALHELPERVCLNSDGIELIANGYESGVIGNGVIGNYFYASEAGLGTHELIYNCCDVDQMESVTIEVVEGQSFTPVVTTLDTLPSALILDIPNDLADYTVQWYLNDEPIDGANNISWTPVISGNYTVEVSVNGCANKSEPIIFEVETGIASLAINGLSELSVSPNPFTAQTQLSFVLEESKEVVIEVLDVSGKTIKTYPKQRFEVGENQQIISFTGNAGMYFVKIDLVDGGAIVKKLSKID